MRGAARVGRKRCGTRSLERLGHRQGGSTTTLGVLCSWLWVKEGVCFGGRGLGTCDARFAEKTLDRRRTQPTPQPSPQVPQLAMAQHPNTRRLRPGTSLWASPSSLLLILACATLALCFQVLVLNPWHHARAARLRGGWGGPLQNDDDPTFTKTAPCDLLRIEASGLDADAFARLYRGRRPLVLTSSSAPAIFFNRRRWPFVVAPQGWEKAALLARHGHNLTVATGAAEDEDEQDLRRLFSSSAMSEAQRGGGGGRRGLPLHQESRQPPDVA